MTVVNDDNQVTADEVDHLIVRAIGEELRRARTSAGWSRPDLVKRMKSQVPVNTYACYEQGIRQCSIPRLFEICQALDVNVLDLLGLAFQRLELGLDKSGVRIDLKKIIDDRREEVKPLRRWARNKLKEDALTTDPNGSAVVRVQWAVVKEMATFCGVSIGRLLDYVRDFTPESVRRP
jgi:transcriptional regulator with XRE-family HTH domain